MATARSSGINTPRNPETISGPCAMARLSKAGNTYTAELAWEKRLPLVYNVSLVLDFNASASR